MRPLLAASVLALVPAAAAAQFTFSVTNGNDSGVGSLRQAVIDANSLNVTGQTITITFNAATAVNLAGFLQPLNAGRNGALGANDNTLVINGNGSTVNGSLDANTGFQALFAYSGTVQVRDLTLANGLARGGRATLGGGGAGLGGGLFVNNFANVSLENVAFRDTRAVGGHAGIGAIGGSGDRYEAGGGMGGNSGASIFAGGGGLYGNGGTWPSSGGGGGGGGIGAAGGNGGSATGTNGAGGIFTNGASAASGGGSGAGLGGAFGGGGGGAAGGNIGGGGGVGATGGAGGFGGGGGGNSNNATGGAGGDFGGGGSGRNGGAGGFGGGGGGGSQVDGSGGAGGFGGGGGGANGTGTGGVGGFGGANGDNQQRPGGGLGAGGAAFVRAGGSLTLIDPVFSGIISATAGTGTAGQGAAVGQGLFLGGTTTLTITGSKTITLGGTDFLGGGGSDTRNTDQTRGLLVKNGTGTLTLSGANSIRGGSRTDAGRLIVAHGGALGGTPAIGDTQLVQTDGTLEVAAGTSYQGKVTVGSGGRFIINGTYSFGSGVGQSFGTETGATVGGSGTFGGSVQPILSQGATVAPGDNSAATLTSTAGLRFVSDATLDFDLGTTSDRLRISGGNFFGPNGTGQLAVLVRDAGGLVYNQPYTLIDWTGATTTNVELTDFALASGSVPGTLAFQGSTLVFTPVPEPAGLLAVTAGAAVAWVRRRRRA